MSNAYEVITWRGHQFDRMTVQAIEAAEKLLGFELTIWQGSYNGGEGEVEQSGNTHDRGGAGDCAPGRTPARTVRCLRAVGFAAWLRKASEGDWDEHIHFVLIGNEQLSPSAARQVEAYKAGRNGLKSNLIDATWRPNPIRPYEYQEALMASEEDKAEFRQIVREELREFFRDDPDNGVDIGGARIVRPRSGPTTLAHVAQQVDDLADELAKG